MMDVETKSIINDLINKFVEVLNINILPSILREDITKKYDKGLEDVGVQFNMNFTRDPEKVQFLEKYTFENIKGMNDEVAEKLRKELSQSIMNLESVDKMKERVQKVMDIASDRARMIARTELNRAENMGSLDAAKQSGLKLMKKWDAHLDNRTSEVCHDLDGKTIPLDAKFRWRGQEFEAPPAHPNCRSTLIYVQKSTKSIEDIDAELKVKYIKKDKDYYGRGKHRYWYRDPKTGKMTASGPLKRPVRSPKKRVIKDIPKLKQSLYENINAEHKKRFENNAKKFMSKNDTTKKHVDPKTGLFTKERSKLHDSIHEKYKQHTEKAKPKDGVPKVAFMAGLPGSGKTFATQDMFEEVKGTEKKLYKDKNGEHYLVMNGDDIKAHLPEYNGGLDASLVHRESSIINAYLISHFAGQKVNLIIDGTLANTEKAKGQLEEFHRGGYKSSLYHVDVPLHQAMIMAHHRYVTDKRFVSYDMIEKFSPQIKESVEVLRNLFGAHMTIGNKMPEKKLMEFLH